MYIYDPYILVLVCSSSLDPFSGFSVSLEIIYSFRLFTEQLYTLKIVPFYRSLLF